MNRNPKKVSSTINRKALKRLGQLFAMLGSSNPNERETGSCPPGMFTSFVFRFWRQ
jgi:hypothetical protein